jgi:hypothetical protein
MKLCHIPWDFSRTQGWEPLDWRIIRCNQHLLLIINDYIMSKYEINIIWVSKSSTAPIGDKKDEAIVGTYSITALQLIQQKKFRWKDYIGRKK